MLNVPAPSRGTIISVLLAFVAVSPALMISGYYGTDEIQVEHMHMHLLDMLYTGGLFYRPLTFLIWETLAHELNPIPTVMHGAFALLQLCNAVILASVIRRFVEDKNVARISIPVFCIFPTSVAAFSYVATLADMLVLLFTLLLLLAYHTLLGESRETQPAWRSALCLMAAALFTALGLVSKETAVIMPAAIVFLMVVRRSTRGLSMVIVSSAVVGAYVAWRAHTIFVESSGSPYALGLDIPEITTTAVAYFLYPFHLFEFEGPGIFANGIAWPVLVSGTAQIALAALLWRKGLRAVPWIYCAAYLCAIGPVLLTGRELAYLLYMSGAVSSVALASVLASQKLWRRAAGGLLLLIAAAHSSVIYANYIQYGVVFTRVLDTARAAILSSSRSQDDLSRAWLAVQVPNDGWQAAAATTRIFSRDSIIEGVTINPSHVILSVSAEEVCAKAATVSGPVIYARVSRDGTLVVTGEAPANCSQSLSRQITP
jgi:hypothetical protein